MDKYILGIWDGHDSGAAIIKDRKVLFAINEERLTRRKLEIKFPELSIKACLRHLNLSPRDIVSVAVSTSDFAKTLARLFPSTKEEYYLIRRRKKTPGFFTSLKKRFKYKITELGYSPATRYLSEKNLRSELRRLGFINPEIAFVDHHLCHAAAAAFFSGFESCLVVTLDGIGDGLSGSISTLQNGTLTTVETISGKHSLGIFFEHVTSLMNMRELEDEGKVMALANYAYPVPDRENPLLDFMRVEGLQIRCRYTSLRLYDELKKILWRYPSEQFAYMAQRTLEVKICELISNCIKKTGLHNIALAGGIFSNIKVNMHIRHLQEVQNCFVFPHMGDGGLALGAAAWINYEHHKITNYPLTDIYWGPSFSDDAVLQAIKKSGLKYQYCENPAREAAALIAQKKIIFWFQGRMEYGPRALGNRSILALPGSQKIRDILNLQLKMRVWYQPFCPSMLQQEALQVLQDVDGCENHFMTMGFMIKDEIRRDMEGVIGVDGSCRPQMVSSNEPCFESLLLELKKRTGKGVVLNTSFNIHGEPLVCSPEDALRTMKITGNDTMFIGNYRIY